MVLSGDALFKPTPLSLPKMKFTSIFVAAGLAFCQAASADSVGLNWWTGLNFTGNKGDTDLQPGDCANLDSSSRNAIRSVKIDSGVSCTFSTTLGLEACVESLCRMCDLASLDCENLFSKTIVAVRDATNAMPKAFIRPSFIKLKQFSADVLLVALAVRTAYLVDAIQVAENPVDFFSHLIQRLRQDIPVFEDVTLWHDPSSSQSFLVNVGLLSKTYRGLQSSEPPWTAFIRLNEPPTLAPENIVQVLADILSQTFNNPISVISSQELTQELMIPVAAILLEYPVAYVPPGDQTAFLSRELLDVYECLLMNAEIGTLNRHTLLKFSCPNIIGIEHTELSPQRLIERMKERFIPRLQIVDSRITLDIKVLAEKFDRVAL